MRRTADSEFLDLCRQVEGIAASWKQALENNDAKSEAIGERAMDNLCVMSDQLSQYRAVDLEGVVAKINVWRILAPEEVLAQEISSPESNLLLSILEDIERLAGAKL